jgi:hypothetical protein
MNQVPFIFGDEIEPRSADLRLTVPPHISSKAALRAVLAEQLRFPEYFGWNWDAFEECTSRPRRSNRQDKANQSAGIRAAVQQGKHVLESIRLPSQDGHVLARG